MKAKAGTSSDNQVLPNFIAANLRLLRKGAGWSQSQLADRLALNRGNIASYESGNAEPNICKTLRISKLFGISARDLIRKDLSDEHELILARIAYSQNEEERKARLTQLKSSSEELSELLVSSRKLFDYKVASISATCPNAEMFVAHYKQLSEVANKLMENHHQLLTELGCHCD